tara:strand:+ start:168 stop:485 length:318 start_codon:yes stop_codon:yes gene_type:complete
MKFKDAVEIVHRDKFDDWWQVIDTDESYIDDCVNKQQEEEQQQEVDVGLKAKECDNCEGGGMLYSPTYYGSDSECDECNGTGKIVTASIEGVLFKVSINSIKEVD